MIMVDWYHGSPLPRIGVGILRLEVQILGFEVGVKVAGFLLIKLEIGCRYRSRFPPPLVALSPA